MVFSKVLSFNLSAIVELLSNSGKIKIGSCFILPTPAIQILLDTRQAEASGSTMQALQKFKGHKRKG